MSIGQDLDRCVPLPLPAEVLVCACPVHFFPWHEHVVLSKLKPVFFCRHWFYVRFVSFTHTPSLGDSIGLRATGRGSWKPMCKIHYLYSASSSLCTFNWTVKMTVLIFYNDTHHCLRRTLNDVFLKDFH